MMQIYTLIISSIIFYRKQNFLAPLPFKKNLGSKPEISYFCRVHFCWTLVGHIEETLH